MKCMIIDTETTGVTPGKHGIVQIALQPVLWRQDDLPAAHGEPTSFRVAPFPADVIDPKAMEVHGLTEAQVRSYSEPKVVFAQLEAFLESHGVSRYARDQKYALIAYNASFDTDMLRAWFVACGSKYFGSWFWVPSIDVMGLAMVELMHEREKLPNFKLGTVAEHMGVTLGKAHDAMGDVQSTLGLLRAIIERQQSRRPPREVATGQEGAAVETDSLGPDGAGHAG